ncbi:hypothetical protein BU24DRAFT_487686 [Aaosphaeria arxii CBS 175.79]|uniref:Uncharacterized protein n=1 Tax=Aaosphaeria arxii CBS 175.79 TaxID=1450172 RepID=A0A6A5Y6R4_9PLEO|nr:uncharacterized protein BU24DRAFT_487686 [Aaosphaeria arxii CBS 175.79]KAF2021228.1 hypothetical protein BU24DRAFT_487686 [Aaosphaeria arxii CBS 175.79]
MSVFHSDSRELFWDYSRKFAHRHLRPQLGVASQWERRHDDLVPGFARKGHYDEAIYSANASLKFRGVSILAKQRYINPSFLLTIHVDNPAHLNINLHCQTSIDIS